jgi:hypothetical protein
LKAAARPSRGRGPGADADSGPFLIDGAKEAVPPYAYISIIYPLM